MAFFAAGTILSARHAMHELMITRTADRDSVDHIFWAAYAPLIAATRGARSEPQHQLVTEEQDRVYIKEKPLLVDIRGRLTTIVTAIRASDNPATGLLIAAGKIAAMSSRLDARRLGAKRLRHYLDALFSVIKVAKDIVRNKEGVITPALQAEALDLVKAHVEACRKGLLQAAPLQGQQGCWPRQLRFTHQHLRWKAAAFQHTLSRHRKLQDPTTVPEAPQTDLPRTDSAATTVSTSNSNHTDNPSIAIGPSPSCDSGRSPSKSDSPSNSSTPTVAPSSSSSSPTSLCSGKAHMPTRAPVSPGAAFVPYRRPSQLAHPRSTSLRGTGAVVRVEVGMWTGRRA